MSNTNTLSILDFYAEWCGPCRMLNPILENLKSKNPNVEIVKINVDEHKEKAAELGIRSLPTVLFMKENSILENVKGLKPEDFYQDLIQKHTSET